MSDRITVTTLRATAATYIEVRERVIPTPAGHRLAYVHALGASNGTSSVVLIEDATGGQSTVLRLAGTMRESWLQLSASIATLIDVEQYQRVTA